MKFAADKMFWLFLLLVPALILFFWWSWRKRQQLITQFTSARLLGHLKVGVSPSRQKFRMVLIVVSVIFLILALARPQWGFVLEEAKQRGLDIMVAIDTSNSMLAEDIQPNRLARAKLATLDLVRKARTDRLGLIAFAGSAFLQSPLTLDDAAFSQSVDSLDANTISQGGTALAEAINTAREAFKDEGDNYKVLVLFTDGEDHDEGAVESAKKAAEEGILIYTVGIGTPEGEQLRIRDDRGRIDYIRDEQGKPVISHLNEKLLEEVATAAKGFYLPLRGTKTMDMLYERGIAPLPKSEKASTLLRRYHERYHWPLLIAILLLILEVFLPDRKRRRSSESESKVPGSTKAISQTAALLLLLAWPVSTFASPSRALRDYEAGNYGDALKQYEKSLERSKNDPRLHFNAGTAAYQSKQLDEALKQFNETLNSQDLNLQQQAYYNLGNTYYRMGQTAQDPKQKQEAWENAIKQFQSALKLNQQDQDAQFNRSFVEKQLEELKKQQQQQQQNQSQDQSKQDSKDQEKKDQQQSKDQKDNQNQQKDSSSQPNKDNQAQSGNQQDKKQDSKQDQQSEQKKQEQDQAKNGNKKDQQKKNDTAKNQSGGQNDQSAEEEAQREAAMMAAGQMTPQQAKQLLDAQKGDEEVLRLAPQQKQQGNQRTLKNW